MGCAGSSLSQGHAPGPRHGEFLSCFLTKLHGSPSTLTQVPLLAPGSLAPLHAACKGKHIEVRPPKHLDAALLCNHWPPRTCCGLAPTIRGSPTRRTYAPYVLPDLPYLHPPYGAATPVAGTVKASRCPVISHGLLQEVRAVLSFLSSSDLPTAQRALQPQCRAAGLPPPASLADAARIAVNAADSKGKQGGRGITAEQVAVATGNSRPASCGEGRRTWSPQQAGSSARLSDMISAHAASEKHLENSTR